MSGLAATAAPLCISTALRGSRSSARPGATIRSLFGTGPNSVVLAGDSATAPGFDGTAQRGCALPASPRRITTCRASSPLPSERPSAQPALHGVAALRRHRRGCSPHPDLGEVRCRPGPEPASIFWRRLQPRHRDQGPALRRRRQSLGQRPYPAQPRHLPLRHLGHRRRLFLRRATAVERDSPPCKTAAAVPQPWKLQLRHTNVQGSGAAVYAVGDAVPQRRSRPTLLRSACCCGSRSGTTCGGRPAPPLAGLPSGAPARRPLFVGTAGTIAHYDGSKFTTTSLCEPLTGVGASSPACPPPLASRRRRRLSAPFQLDGCLDPPV